MAVGDHSITNTATLPGEDTVDADQWKEQTLLCVNRALKVVCFLFFVANFTFISTFVYLFSFNPYSWDGRSFLLVPFVSADTCLVLLLRFAWNYWNHQGTGETKKDKASGDEQKKSVNRAVGNFFWLYVSCNLMIQCGAYYFHYSSRLLSTVKTDKVIVDVLFIAQIVPLLSLILTDMWLIFVLFILNWRRREFYRSLDHQGCLLKKVRCPIVY